MIGFCKSRLLFFFDGWKGWDIVYDLLFIDIIINIMVDLFFLNGILEEFVLFVMVKVEINNRVDLFIIIDGK